MRSVSYSQLEALELEFKNQCKERGIKWTEDDVRLEALNQFIIDYAEGDDDPEVLLCGYGYEIEEC